MSSSSPLRAAIAGLSAGAAGTGVMTAVQTAYMKRTGGKPSSTPAEVGTRISQGVLRREVSADRMQTLNNAMHWLYGTIWGALYGIGVASAFRVLDGG